MWKKVMVPVKHFNLAKEANKKLLFLMASSKKVVKFCKIKYSKSSVFYFNTVKNFYYFIAIHVKRLAC